VIRAFSRRIGARRPILLGLLTLLCSTGQAAPTRLFLQEEGRVAPARAIYVDVINSTGDWTPAAESELRLGLPVAEVLLSPHGIGVKFEIPNGWVPYVVSNLGTSPSTIDYRLGAAYLWQSPGVNVNFDPEVARVSRETIFNFNGAIFFPLDAASWFGPLQLGTELMLTSRKDAATGLAMGFRWNSREWLAADVVIGGSGGKIGNGAIRTPAALRVNIQF